jgi:4'-phosphopantetheinyl transferase
MNGFARVRKLLHFTAAMLSFAMVLDTWLPAPIEVPPLGSDVHVWRIDVPRWRPCVPMLRRLLTPEEQVRADRFRFETDVQSFIVARGILRLLLGDLLHLRPSQVAFTYSPSGKPSTDGIEFNLAHSGEIILIAAHHYDIGVDVEHLDRSVDVVAMSHYFTARECALIAESSASREAFFRLWTRKEAWLKAVGTGFSFPLNRVDVADAAAPLMIEPDAVIDGVLPLRIVDLPLEIGYVGACAVSVPDCGVRLWCLDETWRNNPALVAVNCS